MACADSILVDWNNGRLGSTYAPECYRDALEALPEDVRLYTTAPEEINRALRVSLAARALRRESGKKAGHEQAGTDSAPRQLSGGNRERKPAPEAGEAETTAAPAPAPTSLPAPVLLTVLLILAVCAGGATSSVARRRRVRRARRGAPGPL